MPMNAPATTPVTAAPAGGGLVDQFGRRITYLRLSVTDRCDFRCTYCMAEKMTFLPHDHLMSFEECERVVRVFTELGVTKVRITGGEPLVRRNVLGLLQRIGSTPGVKELVLTTNGSQLADQAHDLVAAGVKRLNISLDSVDPERFRAITRLGRLEQVIAGIDAARVAGFRRIKLNAVLMRGVNDDELVSLVDFAVDRGLDIAFIEEMPLGSVGGRNERYISSDEALERLGTRFTLTASDETTGGPARYWRVAGSDSRVGFIAPHSHNFCDSCNRVRITARGDLYPCLGQDNVVPLLPVLREHPHDDDPLRAAISEGLGMKPWGHEFVDQREAPKVMRFMSLTGG